MSKKSFLVDCLLLALIFVSVVGAFIAILYYKVNQGIALGTAGAVILAVIFIMSMKNYKYSAYGGRFQKRYPNSETRMTDETATRDK